MRAFAEFFLCLTLVNALMTAPSFAQPSGNTVVPATRLSNPQRFVSVDVVGTDGNPIGIVLAVKTDSDGKMRYALVLLATQNGRGRVATVRSERLGFDWDRGLLVADYSPAQLTQLAANATTPPGIDTSQSSGLVQRYGGEMARRLPNGVWVPSMGY